MMAAGREAIERARARGITDSKLLSDRTYAETL